MYSEFLEPSPQNLNDESPISEDLLCKNTAPGLINEYPYGESRKPVKNNIILVKKRKSRQNNVQSVENKFLFMSSQ